MLSLQTSSIQKRRQAHRRQNSTPVIFEAPAIRPLPAITKGHRRGMSVDQKPTLCPSPAAFPARSPTNTQQPIYPSQDNRQSVGISTNPGQNTLQHPNMQVAQQHRLAQPGLQPPRYQDIPQQQQYQPSPATPANQIPRGFFEDPNLHQAPSPQQLKDLEQHIQSVYGIQGTVIIQLNPTPVSTPQKPPPLPAPENLDSAPMPASFDDLTSVNLDPPTANAMDFFENPESPYYSSEAFTSPTSSPQQRTMDSFMDEYNAAKGAPQLSFSETTQLLPPSQSSFADFNALSSPSRASITPISPHDHRNGSISVAGVQLDATIEDTGISAEDVQQYISQQDSITHRWTCLFPDCGKDFGRRENIRSHVQTHLGDRQYRCNHCSKCFVRQHDLKRHARIHDGDRPYVCPCGSRFARQDALTRHRQRGTCEGAFPNVVKKVSKRGRPKKARPAMDERLDKARKTREKVSISKYAESFSDGSDFPSSPPESESFGGYDTAEFHKALSQSNNELASDPFSFDTASSPFSSDSPMEMHNTTFGEDQADTLFRLSLEAFSSSQTPPSSPPQSHCALPHSNHASPAGNVSHHGISPKDIMSSPTKASASDYTPPTSPAYCPEVSQDDLELISTLAGAMDSVPAMDMSMFCVDGDLLGGNQSFNDSMAWMNDL